MRDASNDEGTARLRALPQVQRLLEHEDAQAPIASTSRPAMTAALRRVLADARDALRHGTATAAPDAPALIRRATETLGEAERPGLRAVINATGIVLHTNLGRAPMAPEAVAAAAEAACGYANLELDLATGGRGHRLGAVEFLVREITGAEAAVAVNNGAAAVLLALAAHAPDGGEVVVSRGELVEIGGGFRIPEVIAQGGAKLIEVGTTNRTRLADYETAIGPRTRMLLKVHRSNFRITGFTEEAAPEALAGLARARGLVLMHDLGCGMVANPRPDLTRGTDETTVGSAIRAGCDLVAFSGDKLLGGPQAGIVAGSEAAVAPLRRHPLMRALRLDKMTLAALDATLRLHRGGTDPGDGGTGRDAMLRVPALRMLSQPIAVLEARAERLCEALMKAAARPGASSGPLIQAAIEPSVGEAGGGALPGLAIPSRAVGVSVGRLTAEGLLRALRGASPRPVIARIQDGRVVLDMLTVGDDALDTVASSLREIAFGAGTA